MTVLLMLDWLMMCVVDVVLALLVVVNVIRLVCC